jgi:hypothetical protein
MKLDAGKVLGGIALALIIFIAGKVWESVEIAKENRIRIEYIRDNQKELRTDLDTFMAEVSELSKRVD